MKRVHIASIVILLILSAIILTWLLSNFLVSPLAVSTLILCCIFDSVLEFAYQRRTETQKKRDTEIGVLVNASGMLLFLTSLPLLLFLGVPSNMLGIGLFVMIIILPVFGFLGRLLSTSSGTEETD